MSMPAREASASVLYFLAYVLYLAWRPEGEFFHWLSLVGLPVLLLFLVRRGGGEKPHWQDLLRSTGLSARPTRSGTIAALVAGILISCLQLDGRNGGVILDLFRSGRALWLWPFSFLLMVVTAAGTEEFFFRGVLQKRLTVVLDSRVAAIGVTSVLFALYHVPYAYNTADWGTAHDLWGAVRASAETGLPLGVLLGGVFAFSGESLAASVAAHALINALPGMLVVQRLFPA
jgi:membrane protease YdiL (CAAX protease family)